jgi:hypothetical protein
MDCLSLLVEARAAGLTLTVEGERLTLRGPKAAESLARHLLARKDEILALGERYEERAAILEFEGGWPRFYAERLAMLEVLGVHCNPNRTRTTTS